MLKFKKTKPGFGLSKGEKNTYKEIPRIQKERVSEQEVNAHWRDRAKRKGLQAVMSARHWKPTNWVESKRLKFTINRFLKGHVAGKKVFELGAGIGRMTAALAKNAKKVVSFEPSSIMHQKAQKNLEGTKNVSLTKGKIFNYNGPKKFNLVFESIVLLHILNPAELKRTANKMKELCAKNGHIFLCEHVWEKGKSQGSKYSIFRKPEEYVKLFEPFELVKMKQTRCAGDKFMLYLFRRKK